MARKRSDKKIKKVFWFLLSFTCANTSFCAETPYPPGEAETRPLTSSGIANLLRGSASDNASAGGNGVVLVEEEDGRDALLQKCLQAIEGNNPDELAELMSPDLDLAALQAAQQVLQHSIAEAALPHGDTSMIKATRILSIILEAQDA